MMLECSFCTASQKSCKCFTNYRVSFGMKRGQRIFVDFLHDTSSNFDFKTDTALYVTIQYIQTVVSKCTPKSK